MNFSFSRSNLFLSTLIAFLTGILIHSWAPKHIGLYSILTLVSGALSLFLIIKPKGKVFLLLSLIITSLSLGIYRGQINQHIPSESTVDFYTSEEPNNVTLYGTIAEEPDVRRNKVNYTVLVNSIQTPQDYKVPSVSKVSTHLPVSGYTLISLGKHPRYYYGDSIQVSGHLQKPVVFDSFDYAGYLSRFNIYSVMYRPYVKKIQDTNLKAQKSGSVLNFEFGAMSLKNWFFSNMLIVKQSFESQMNRTFSSEPYSSFMAGLLLGSRKGIPDALNQDFQTTGLSHIIAISGYNITLLVTIFMAIFRPFGKKASIIISAIAVIIFTFFVGASPAVVRACIMGLISLVALNSERKGNITLGLFFTAAVMIGYNPKILAYDVGFQLSFLATMGLIYVSPLIEPYFKWIPETLALRESILLTTSAQIMALPIILFNFQNLSLVSPLSNLLISGPTIPFAMLFGFISTIVSYFWISLAKLIAFPAYLLLNYIIYVIQWTAKIPFAAVSITWFSQPMFITYFIGLIYILKKLWSTTNLRQLRINRQKVQFQQLIWQQVYDA
ncbi:MAG: ComEC/Rec2 family competence protein [Candidatus Gracilibacteria bacterium]|nr:ComEC/Rec2 family competence protein [Candidatus Gracilibacteria bacterium]